MKTEITPEAIQALLQSSEMLKAVCERAARCEAVETALTARKTPLHNVILEARQRLGPHLLDFPGWERLSLPEIVHQVTGRIESLTAQQNTLVRDRHAIAEQRDQEVRSRDAWKTAADNWRERYDKEVRSRDAWKTAADNWRERYDKEVAKNGDLVKTLETAQQSNRNQFALVQDLRGAIARQDERIGELLRENETLARNVPPEPSAEEWREGDSPQSHPNERAAMPTSVFDTPSGAVALPDGGEMVTAIKLGNPTHTRQVCRVLGQQWCRVKDENDVPADAIGNNRHGGWMVLCNVLQDTVTGALTYRPLAVKDLPLVP